jgi:hypothetical protein
VNVTMIDGRVYDDVADTAHRLEREQLIERHEYEVSPGHKFPACGYCEGVQGEAVLSWTWERWDSTSNGCADCCCSSACCKAVLSEAEQDTDPENILVEHPVVVLPNTPAIAA